MKDASRISESELEIMKTLWKSNPLSANEIKSLIEHKVDWSLPTIKTFLNRLMKKEIIGYEKSGRKYFYFPLVSYDDYVKVENNSFLHRVYDGALNMLFSKFLEEKNLSKKDIDRLQKILEDKKEDIDK
ncbi:BlaI/MecI/CopY family transcriptional regulator [Dethiothermospora halolimnae]|uniref:BlaI/MecI/CopY family transcriptional regulator n=1 Tax=Dethiothermospora halolimnae TaxID=3114390 RepID=UPI003CCC37E0